MFRMRTRANFPGANIPRADFHGIGGGGSDSFSGRRKLFWGNDDHLKSFQLVQSYLWTLGRNYRGISLDEKDPNTPLYTSFTFMAPIFPRLIIKTIQQ